MTSTSPLQQIEFDADGNIPTDTPPYWRPATTREEFAARQDRRCDKALDTASEVCPRCFRQHTWLMEGP